MLYSNISGGTAIPSKDTEDDFSDGPMEENDIQVLAETENDVPEIALSFIWQGNKIGGAYFNFDTSHLYLFPDQYETAPSFSVLGLLLKQAEPVSVVTSSRTDEKLINFLKEVYFSTVNSETSSNSSGMPNSDQQLHLLPNIDFAYESTKHRLQNMNLPNMPKNMNDVEKRIYFSSLIDFTHTCMIRAAGGLLKFIEKKDTDFILRHLGSSNISGISTLSLNNVVNIDENTYRALHIFQEERHPSVYKSTSGIKEGLSLYSTCNGCKSAIGKKEMKYCN